MLMMTKIEKILAKEILSGQDKTVLENELFAILERVEGHIINLA